MLTTNADGMLTIDIDSRKESGLKLTRAAKLLAVYKGLDPQQTSDELMELGCREGYYVLVRRFEELFGDICVVTEFGRPRSQQGSKILPIFNSVDDLPTVNDKKR